jgi:hypothetical protein
MHVFSSPSPPPVTRSPLAHRAQTVARRSPARQGRREVGEVGVGRARQARWADGGAGRAGWPAGSGARQGGSGGGDGPPRRRLRGQPQRREEPPHGVRFRSPRPGSAVRHRSAHRPAPGWRGTTPHTAPPATEAATIPGVCATANDGHIEKPRTANAAVAMRRFDMSCPYRAVSLQLHSQRFHPASRRSVFPATHLRKPADRFVEKAMHQSWRTRKAQPALPCTAPDSLDTRET